MSPRLDLLPGPESVQVVGPSLHHYRAFGKKRRPVVGPAVGIPHRVCQLVLDEVWPERSGPAFWVATHREVRCAVRALVAHGVAAEENPPGITRIGRGCRIHRRGFYRALGAPRDAEGGGRKHAPLLPAQAAGRMGSRARRVRLRRSGPPDHHGAPLLIATCIAAFGRR